ncbi:MAG: hypothetical protein EA412_04455 [Chitinophagaceae bacterium]|nr:MAG: hypothetical protein EA412_04455 [Chitinophagaceae bacterium]
MISFSFPSNFYGSILILFIIAFPSCKDCEEILIEFKEFAEIEEEYIKKIPFPFKTLDDTISFTRINGYWGTNVKPQLMAFTSITNMGNKSGMFTVELDLVSGNHRRSFILRKMLRPGVATFMSQTVDIPHFSFQNSINVENVKIIPPHFEVTEQLPRKISILRTKICNSCKEDCEAIKELVNGTYIERSRYQ